MTRPFILGIAGGSASGKSTFTDTLLQHLEGVAFERITSDSYFFPPDQMPTFYSPTQDRDMPDFNQPGSMDLPRLVADLDAHSAAGSPDLLILEGLMVLHYPQIRERLDLRLFVDLEPDQRALRRLVRNLERKYDPFGTLSTPRAMANYYLESARVGHERYVEPSKVYADFILRGDADFNRTASMVAAMLKGLMKPFSTRSERG